MTIKNHPYEIPIPRKDLVFWHAFPIHIYFLNVVDSSVVGLWHLNFYRFQKYSNKQPSWRTTELFQLSPRPPLPYILVPSLVTEWLTDWLNEYFWFRWRNWFPARLTFEMNFSNGFLENSIYFYKVKRIVQLIPLYPSSIFNKNLLHVAFSSVFLCGSIFLNWSFNDRYSMWTM